MTTRILVAALLGLIPSTMLAADTRPTQPDQHGELWALVLHSETGVGLEGMPVYVDSAAEGNKKQIVVLSGKDGFAHVTGLVPGDYTTWVDFNNHQSEVISFTIDESLLAKVAIHFNPDID